MSEKMRRDAKNISKTMLNTTHHQNYHPEDDMAHENLSNLKLFTCNSHPELAGTEFPKDIAEEALSTGQSLLSVYEKHTRNDQAEKIRDLVKENQVLKQNAETAKRAPVTGVTGHGIEGNEPDDDFLAGFNWEAW